MLRQTYSFAGTYTGDSLQRGPSSSSSQVGKDVHGLLQHTHFVGANKGKEEKLLSSSGNPFTNLILKVQKDLYSKLSNIRKHLQGVISAV